MLFSYFLLLLLYERILLHTSYINQNVVTDLNSAYQSVCTDFEENIPDKYISLKMSRIRFSDQVHHSNEMDDNYYRHEPPAPSIRTPSDINDYYDDYYSKGQGENEMLLNNYHGRSYSRSHRKVRKERSFDSLPLSEYGNSSEGYGHSSMHGTLPRRLKTSKTTYFSPGVRAAQEVSAAAAYHLNRPSSALPNRPRPDYLDGPNLDETCFNFQNTDTDPYYAMREMMPPPGDPGRQLDRSSSYLTVPSTHNGSILKTETNLDDEYTDGYNYEDHKSSNVYPTAEGRLGIQANNGSNYSSSSPRSAMSAESMGGGSYSRQQSTGILKKESILKNGYQDNNESERRTSGRSQNSIIAVQINFSFT